MLLKILIKEQPLGAVGGVVLLLLVLVSIFADSFARRRVGQTAARPCARPSGGLY